MFIQIFLKNGGYNITKTLSLKYEVQKIKENTL